MNQPLNIPYIHLSAFADDIHSGNPAAVVLLTPELDSQLDTAARAVMSQNFNQPMTAFIVPHGDVGGATSAPNGGVHKLPSHIRAYNIRYFTQGLEMPLCGHATLCAGAALFADSTRVSPDVTELHFHAQSTVVVARKAEEERIEITIRTGKVADFAEGDPREVQLRQALKAALGDEAKVIYVGAGQGHLDWYTLVEIDDPDLASLKINIAALLASPFMVHVITTRSKDPKYAFLSRMFPPSSGLFEDHVCGTANTLLAPYWAAKDGFEAKLDGEGILARQVSPRGGDLKISRQRDMIKLAGKVVTLARGEVFV